MKRQYTFYNDPGHGWLEVTLEDICTLGICQKISSYSYVDINVGNVNILVYLEEDCDAGIYLEAYKNKYGKLPKIKDKYIDNNIFIRNLPSFNGNMPEIIKFQEVCLN